MSRDWNVENLVHPAAGGRSRLHGSDHFPLSQSIYIRGNAITLLVGSNGSGKSTLLESLAGLRKPLGGSIRLGEEPLWERGRPNRSVLLSLGIAMQRAETQWFARTVRDELHYSMRPYKLDKQEQAV